MKKFLNILSSIVIVGFLVFTAVNIFGMNQTEARAVKRPQANRVVTLDNTMSSSDDITARIVAQNAEETPEETPAEPAEETTNTTSANSNEAREVDTSTAAAEPAPEPEPEPAPQPNYVTKRYDWPSLNGDGLWIELAIDTNTVDYLNAIEHQNSRAYLWNYVGDSTTKDVVGALAGAFRNLQSQFGWSEEQTVREAVHFVQYVITYQKDIDGTGIAEYYKYPIQTLYTQTGDCEDTSILVVSLINELGYGARFLGFPGHIAAAVKGYEGMGGTYYEIDGGRFYYIETTGLWDIGEVPNDCQGQSAKIY